MKTLILLLLTFTPCFVLNAQNKNGKISKPDYPSIEKETKDQNSIYNYEKLLKRYEEDDSLLTNLDYKHLYFGMLFRPEYSPYQTSSYSDSLKVLFRKDSPGQVNLDKTIYLEKKILKEMPFSVRDLNTLAYAYHEKGDVASESKIVRKLTGIVYAIIETGDGKTEETAFHVISVSHEYDLLNVLGLQYAGEQSLTSKNCDYLTVKKNDRGLNGIYFDVSQILNTTSRLLKK